MKCLENNSKHVFQRLKHPLQGKGWMALLFIIAYILTCVDLADEPELLALVEGSGPRPLHVRHVVFQDLRSMGLLWKL